MDKDRLSQRTSLEKAMSLKDYISIGLGTIVGIGWIMFVGVWLTRGGPLGAMLAFIIGGFLLISIGKAFAELTPAIPVSGGGAAFAYKAFGKSVSFLTIWLYVFGYVFACPFMLVATGWLFETFFPSLKTQTLYTVAGYQVGLSGILPGLLIGLAVIILNYTGIKSSARFQTISTFLMIACVIIITLVGLIKGRLSNLLPLFSKKGTVWSGPLSIVAVLGMVPFFMAGYDTIAQAAEESSKKMNPKNLGKAIIISIVSAALFYCAVILAPSLCMPWQEAIKLEMPAAEVFHAALGYDWATKIVLLTGFLGLVTSLNGCFLGSTRLLFAAGRGGLLPYWFEEVNEKRHTPKNAIFLVGFLSLLGPFFGRSSFVPIANVGALVFTGASFITCLAALKLRKTSPDLKRPYKVKHKGTLYFGTFAAGALIVFLIFPGSPAQLDWPVEYLLFIIWLVLGFLGYWLRQRRKDMTKEERDFQILGEYR